MATLPIKDRAHRAVSSAHVRPASHKLAVPEGHWNAIARQDLLRALFAVSTPPRVVVLQAPAGHGKTSLLVQAESTCRRQGRATGWLTLDETDDDASRLFDHLLDLADRLAVEPADAGGDGDATTTANGRVVARFSAVGRPTAVFIDDMHFVRNHAALDLLTDLLARPIPGLRWFIGTRTHPEIGSARLVVGGQATVLDAADLRFTPAEAREFFDQGSGPRMSESELASVTEATEGWPAALQLYRLARRSAGPVPAQWQQAVRGSVGLTEYLGENVLHFQEPDVQDFLLGTCGLERMSADLCDAVLERADSAAALALLEERGLFVRRLTSAEGWFTYHALFSTFLRNYLRRRNPERVAQLHRRAAAWFDAHGHSEDALHHYVEAGDLDAAAEVFDRWLETLVPSGHMVTVDRWLDAFPPAVLATRPSLMVKVLWALAFLSRHQKLDPVLRLWRENDRHRNGAGGADPALMLCIVDILADRLIESDRHITGIDPRRSEPGDSRFRTFELGVVCNARGYKAMATGDLDEAMELLTLGRQLNRRAGAMFALAYSMGKAALTLLAKGRLPEAIDLWQAARSETMQHLEGSLAEASLVCGHLSGLYEAGHLDTALAEFEQHRELIEVGAIHDYFVIAHRAASRVHDTREQYEAAEAVLERGRGLALARQWPRVERLLSLEQARRAVLAGRLDQAEVLLGAEEHVGDPRVVRVSEETEDETIGRARYEIAIGAAPGALRRIDAALGLARRQGRVRRAVTLHVLAASALRGLGEFRPAHRRLRRALELAAPSGFVRAFLDEGEGVHSLLDEHRCLLGSAPPSATSVTTRQFLSAIVPPEPGAGPTPPQHPVTSAGRLTPREEEVLTLLAGSLSNAEIARATFVSADTVKFHLKNIYAKIGARNRVDAARIARTLGLQR